MFVYMIFPLKKSFVHMCMLMYTAPGTYYKDKNILELKVNLMSIPLTISLEPSVDMRLFLF